MRTGRPRQIALLIGLVWIAMGSTSPVAHAEALYVRGAVLGSWSAPVDTVVIDSFAWVAESETLRISPGMVVAFSGRFSLVVNGTLLADGLNDDSIRVQRLPYHASDGHLGFRFRNTSTLSRLNKVVFEDGFANTGDAERYGGAIELHFAEVEIDSCSFLGNRARIDGGAIYSREAGTLTIRECDFIGDSTRFGAGGAVLARTSGTVTIERSRFVNNRAITSGGAVVTESGVTSRISECYFSDNFAFQRGGALWLRSTPPAGYVRECIIENCTADQGGGIYLDNARGTVEACSVRFCSARVGGGIASRGTNNTTTLTRSVLSGNTATEDGGGIYFVESARSVLSNSILVENTASRGGAVYCASGTSPVFRFVTAEDNFAGEGAVFSLNGAGLLTNSIVTGTDSLIYFSPLASTQISFSNIFASEGSEITGTVPEGLLNDSRLNVALVPCDSLRNISLNPRFADASSGDFQLATDSPCLFGADTSNSGTIDFAGNARIAPNGSWPDMGAFESTAQLPYGDHCGPQRGVWFPGDYVIGCTLRVAAGDTLTIMGGSRLLFAPEAGLEIEGTLFAFGTVRDSIIFDRYFELPASTWSGIRISANAESRFNFCQIQSVVGVPTVHIESGRATFRQCRFTNNTNANGCGAALFSQSQMPVVIDECRFDGNAAASGGAVCVNGGQTQITACLFEDNQTVSDTEEESLGGAVYCTGGAILDGCRFARNRSYGGGAVYSESPRITSCMFDSCSATLGGAVLQREVPCEFERLRFQHNSSTEGGGAVYISGTECSDLGSSYLSNHSLFGGAIGVDNGAYAGDSAQYSDNSAESGGAFWIGGNAFAQFSNSILYRNHARDGGAAYADGGGIDLEYCLLDSNFASRLGGGVYLGGGGMLARKCTFVKNAAPTTGGIIRARGNAFVTANSSLFAGNAEDIVVPGDDVGFEFTFCLSDSGFGRMLDSVGWPLRVNFNGDSCDHDFNLIAESEFVNFAARDYRLLSTSRAIHAADSILPLDDDGTRADIGLFPGTRPYALPRPFNLTLPLNAERVNARDYIAFTWNESHDDDPGDVVTYQLRLVGESIDMTFDTEGERSFVTGVPRGEYTWWVVATSQRPATSRESFEQRELIVYETIGAANEHALPTEFRVGLAGPNPFNSTTQLELALPRPAQVSLHVHDVLGREALHMQQSFAAGVHTIGVDGSSLSSGVYWVTVRAGVELARIKVMLLK